MKVAFKTLKNKSLRNGNPITFILKLLNPTNYYSIADRFSQLKILMISKYPKHA